MTAAAVVTGLGAYVPERIVSNEEIASRLGVSDDWVFSRTGIRQRHVIEPGMATSDLAVRAGERAILSAGGCPIDAVIVATATPDYQMPATAPIVAARLHLGGVMAFDISAVCSGFVYGLATASSLITAGLAKRILLIGADTFSTVVHPDDQAVAPLFGDGAGAVVLRAGHSAEAGALTAFHFGSDGEQSDLIIVRSGGSRQRRSLEPGDAYLAMQGKQVFSNAVLRMAESSRAVLAQAGRVASEVDRIVGHQANVRILRAVANQLDVPVEKLVTNLESVGNTSAASIPLALADAVSSGRLSRGELVLLTAFGSGLTWGSTLLKWPDTAIVNEGAF